MFEKGDLIVYASTGVCRVEDVGPSPFDPATLTYKLVPLYDNGAIYIPVDTKMFMRPVLTREEAETLIDAMPAIEGEDYAGAKRPEMLEHYRGFLQSHTCEDLLRLMKTLYDKDQRLSEGRKHLGTMEQDFKKRAEDLLYGELAVALGIPLQEVAPYIARRLEAAEQEG